MIDVSNWGRRVPPYTQYFKDLLYANFAPPFQAEFTQIEPHGKEARSSLDYAVRADGSNAATQSLTQNPKETVQQALAKMMFLIVTQLGAGKVETRP